MILGDAIASTLPELRREAESRMTDTCRITTPGTGDPVLNQDTGQYTDPAPVTVYEGKCRLRAPAQVNAFTASGAGADWQVEQSVLSLPALAPAVESGMTVTYLTAPLNPSLEGHVFGVVGPHRESQATAQRVIVKEIVGAGGTGT
jgi:hypothetical protein